MPLPTKTTEASIKQMFEQRYKIGMTLSEIAQFHDIHFSYCCRLLRADLRQDITINELKKYRPSWVKG